MMQDRCLPSGDILTSIAQGDDCLTLRTVDSKSLSEYIVALANTGGGRLAVGIEASTITGVEPDAFELMFSDAIKKVENVEAKLLFESGLRGIFTLAIVDVEPSKALASFDGVILELVENTPCVMPERDILNRLGLGIDSDLINSMARQLSVQSLKIGSLQQTVDDAGKLKNQWKSLLVGAGLGVVLSEAWKVLFA
ncbi:helix-turn-helix domain-containing protein [Vibrio maritimus]